MSTLYSLKRDLEKIVGKIHGACLEHRKHDKDNKWFAVYYGTPNFNQVNGYLRKIEILRQFDSDLDPVLLPLSDELLAKSLEVMQAKEAEEQIKKAKKKAQAAKAALKETKRTNPYHGLNELVAKVLREVAEPYRKNMVADVLAHEQARLKSLEADIATAKTCCPSVLYPYPKRANQFDYAQYQQRQEFARRYLVCASGTGGTSFDSTWSLSADVQGIAQRYAEQIAEDVVVSFIQKVGMKLSGIVEKKGNLTNTAISGSLSDHWMTFTFADGSTFQVQSQIVWKRSVNGVHFNQFPTCFRNVILADGLKMRFPSEVKMKKEFV